MRSKMWIRAGVVAASAALFACGDDDGNGLVDARVFDAGVVRDAPAPSDASVRDGAIDAPSVTSDARRFDAPVVPPADARTFDAPVVVPDAPIVLPDAVPMPDAFIADAFFVGDAGVTQMKSFHFTLDSDTLFQSFATEGAAMTWRGDDGDPPGSLSFTAIAEGTVKVVSPAFTWETWGVPPGATVAYVGITSYKRRLAAVSDMGHQWAFQLVGADNLPAHDGENGAYLEYVSLAVQEQPTWETVTEGLQNWEVKPGYRASNTTLFIKVWYFPLLNGAIDWRLDEIELDVVYVMP